MKRLHGYANGIDYIYRFEFVYHVVRSIVDVSFVHYEKLYSIAIGIMLDRLSVFVVFEMNEYMRIVVAGDIDLIRVSQKVADRRVYYRFILECRSFTVYIGTIWRCGIQRLLQHRCDDKLIAKSIGSFLSFIVQVCLLCVIDSLSFCSLSIRIITLHIVEVR